MALTARSIDVNAPLRAVNDQWTRFEEFPLFMEGVEEVRLESEKFLLCKIKDWEVEITNQVSDQEILWESVDGSSNSGTITFGELDPQWTRVTASIGSNLKEFWRRLERYWVLTQDASKEIWNNSATTYKGRQKDRMDGEDGSQTKTLSNRMFCLWGDLLLGKE